MPDTEGVPPRLRASRRCLRQPPFHIAAKAETRKGQFKGPGYDADQANTVIVGLAEGARMSAIVDEVDMGFSCWLKHSMLSSVIIMYSQTWNLSDCEKWTHGSPSACTYDS